MPKKKKPNLEFWESFRDNWIDANGLVPQKTAARIFNVTEGHISRHAINMNLETQEGGITFKSIMAEVNRRK